MNAQDTPHAAIKDFLEGLFSAANLAIEVRAKSVDHKVMVKLDGPDAQGLVTRANGSWTPERLEALALLASRVAPGEEKTIVIIDAMDYRAKREEELQALASRVAEKAKAGMNLDIFGMTSVDRRALHRGIAAQQVETQSNGRGLFRRLMVRKPKRQQ